MRGMLGFVALVLVLQPIRSQPPSNITGKVEILDKGDLKRRVIQDVVIFVDGVKIPESFAARTEELTVRSHNKTFIPHVQAAMVGSTIRFPNMDDIMHNVFSISRGNRFDLGLYKSGASKTTRFDSPGLVRIYCHIHPQMNAFVLVLDSPFYTMAAPDGSFRIENVPPGNYTVRAWHEQAHAYTKVTVGTDGADVVNFLLDASRFKKRPHLNKFGKPYKKRVKY